MDLQAMLDELGLNVAREVLPDLDRLVDELLRWNQRRNLTAITNRDDVIEKHLADSLTLLPFARQSSRLFDIGSGAGFPSLPLKICRPELEVVSVDAVGKKVDFQRHICRSLALKGFVALHERVESLKDDSDYRAGFDLVTARALCSLAELVVIAEPFLAPAGRLVALKGPEGFQEFSEQQSLLQQHGWSAVVHPLVLPVSGAERCLVELSR